MNRRHTACFLGITALTTWALQGAFAPSTSAQSCPDVQVLFARGTGEAPGVGPTGQAFVDDLRSRIGGRSLDVYPVNYPASDQWSTGIDGVRDAGTHVISMASSCPQTKMVLGGYSQGAAVMGFVTSPEVPDSIDPTSVPKPLSPQVADHVAAVVLFGMPNVRAMNFLGQPPVVIGPMFAGKTTKVCVAEDPVCSDGLNFAAHDTYADDATMVDQGAAYAASRLGGNPIVGPPPAAPFAPPAVPGAPPNLPGPPPAVPGAPPAGPDVFAPPLDQPGPGFPPPPGAPGPAPAVT